MRVESAHVVLYSIHRSATTFSIWYLREFQDPRCGSKGATLRPDPLGTTVQSWQSHLIKHYSTRRHRNVKKKKKKHLMLKEPCLRRDREISRITGAGF